MWFRDSLDFPSKLRFALWRASGDRFMVKLRLKNGAKVLMRPKPYNDASTTHEMFVLDVYGLPSSTDTGRLTQIVDIGANVGYSCVYWLYQYPDAKIIAYEPHPAHIEQIRRHIIENNAAGRVTLIPKAAGAERGHMYLTDTEYTSTLVTAPGENTVPVEVADIFTDLAGKKIDIMKIDIEGGEYYLLSDARFQQLDIKLCVIEWHNTDNTPDGCAWCKNKLEQFGYEVQLGKIQDPNNGLLWAFRKQDRVHQDEVNMRRMES